LRGKNAIKTYVESLGLEAREWLLALYGRSVIGAVGCRHHSAWRCFQLPRALRPYPLPGLPAGRRKSFILVHNHPSGDPSPSSTDIRLTVRLANVSRELDMPLLDHLIIAGDAIISCGNF